MDIQQIIADLLPDEPEKLGKKMVLLVADGIGGLPAEPGGPTELEAADTPNLDRLAQRGVLGSMTMVAPGITPGSGPGHLALFGYDPVKCLIGRGALEATGVGFELESSDVAIRCNFCTIDERGIIIDRRAGRIPTEQSSKIVEELAQKVSIPGVELFVRPVKEHRFLVVFRGEGLGDRVRDTDPGQEGRPSFSPQVLDPNDAASRRTAEVATEFLNQAKPVLAKQEKANWMTMRGFACRPNLPSYYERYKLRAAAVAVYPMYKGLARLAGMTIEGQPATLEEEIDVLEQIWDRYDFFFVHFKYTDSRGEDGNFSEKVRMIEQFDGVIPRVEALRPDVLVVTGDHSTPARLRSHSWHPVPVLLVADACRPDRCKTFGEGEALCGGLGHFEAKYLMPLMLAHAQWLKKFGA